VPAGGLVQPYQHFESPESKHRFAQLVTVSGLIEHLKPLRPRPATTDEVLQAHTADHLDHIRTQSSLPRGGICEDGFSPIGCGSYEIALLAAGGAINAVQAVVDGTVDNAYALVRPPGHHATRREGMGYCLFNNIAIAALHARRTAGVERIAIVDWDVHHCNGTQDIFWDDADTLVVSLHQDRCYPPNTGAVSERGGDSAIGANVNVPLPPGSGREAYLLAFDKVVIPALRTHRPDLVLVSCGFDAGILDPLARQMLLVSTFAEMTRRVMSLADEFDAPIAFVHEGGYSPVYVPFCGLAVVEALAGIDTGTGEPFAALGSMGGQELTTNQRDAVEAAAGTLARH
jgi:acetoin utilization deacetylase AcuC-like enzyme